MGKKPKSTKSKLVKGTEPEALAKFAQVARNDDGQPVREGMLLIRLLQPFPQIPN